MLRSSPSLSCPIRVHMEHRLEAFRGRYSDFVLLKASWPVEPESPRADNVGRFPGLPASISVRMAASDGNSNAFIVIAIVVPPSLSVLDRHHIGLVRSASQITNSVDASGAPGPYGTNDQLPSGSSPSQS